jgi:hypothetical protein
VEVTYESKELEIEDEDGRSVEEEWVEAGDDDRVQREVRYRMQTSSHSSVPSRESSMKGSRIGSCPDVTNTEVCSRRSKDSNHRDSHRRRSLLRCHRNPSQLDAYVLS